MMMDTKIFFTAKSINYPNDRIYNLAMWKHGVISETSKYINNNFNFLKKLLKDICIPYKITYSFTSYSAQISKNTNYDDIIVISVETEIDNKSYKNNYDKDFDINNFDLKIYSNAELNTLKKQIDDILFIRENNIDEATYDFYLLNKKKFTLNDVIEFSKTHDITDVNLMKKMYIREKLKNKNIKLKKN